MGNLFCLPKRGLRIAKKKIQKNNSGHANVGKADELWLVNYLEEF